MKIIIVIVIFYFKHRECLNCSYVDDNILEKAKWIDVTSNLLDNIQTSNRYAVHQDLPKLCTRLEPVLDLEGFTISNTNTMVLGEELFKNYNLTRFTSTFNHIKVIYSKTFLNVTLVNIELSSNDIEVIEEEAFKDLKYLTALDLSNNKLTSINSKMFVNLVSLNEFIVADNYIKEMATCDLDFLKGRSIKTINLSCNSLQVLQSKSLSNLTLERLFIERNLLTDIQDDVFEYSCIQYLYINKNKLSTISENNLKRICNLTVMEFNKNIRNNEMFNGQIVMALYIALIILFLIAFCIYYKIYI